MTYFLLGFFGVFLNMFLFALIYFLQSLCGALRSQPSGPPKPTELFNITSLGETSRKFSISAEYGTSDLFLAAPGLPHKRVTMTNEIGAGEKQIK
eukprot:1334456-Amorphochlora_amoeboformis.AAC.2